MQALNDWKDEFLRIVDIRIENFTTHPHLYKQAPSRSVKALKRKMEKLHSKYVFAPADKAANNVIIIWKRYYVEILKEELNSTSTYVPAQLTKDKLLLRHIDTLTKSNIKIDKLDLPTFYLLPKLHKNPEVKAGERREPRKFCHFNYKMWKKVGGGGTNPLVPPNFESVGAQTPAAPSPTP